MRLKKFTNPKFLEQLGRELLARLIGRYAREFAAASLSIPSSISTDEEYLAAFKRLCLGEPGLPEGFAEALYCVEALANPAGRERLLALAPLNGLRVEAEAATDAEFALEVFLASPERLMEEAEMARIQRLSSFEYYLAGAPRIMSAPCDWEEVARRVKTDIDAWQAEQREQQERITQVEHYALGTEHWFLIRRGDAFVRIPTVENRAFTVRYFRPARDLVVIFAPAEQELRVHARSLREKAMLRRVFGQQLFANPEHFSSARAFTLGPLRECGAEALAASHIHGIERVALVGLDVRAGGEHPLRIEYSGTDLLASADGRLEALVPPEFEVTAAVFEVLFRGMTQPRKIRLCAPNVLRVSRFCDAGAVCAWLVERGFRDTRNLSEESYDCRRVEMS